LHDAGDEVLAGASGGTVAHAVLERALSIELDAPAIASDRATRVGRCDNDAVVDELLAAADEALVR